MARTHKTAQIKARMAEQARQEEEARLARVSSARTRSERAHALTSLRSHQQQEGGPHVPDKDADEDDNAGADEDAGDDADEEAGEVGGGHEEADEEEEGEKVDEEEEGGDEEEQGGDEEEWEDDEQSDEEEECREENQGSAEAESEMAGEGIDSRAKSKAKRRRGKKRSVSDVEEETLVRVPGFKVQHDSWPKLEASLQEYMEATRQKIVVKEVINTARRNAELRAQVRFRGRPDLEIPLVPDEMEPYQRKYICTHGWSERERSTGKRTSHMLHRTECPFQMLAQVTKKCDGRWGITMKREVFCHNHVVSEDIYRSYPGIRQVSVNSPLMPGIDLLVDAQAGTQSVYDYIRKNSNHRVTMDDVGNMIRRMRNKGDELSDNDAVAEMIINFNLESPMNVTSVHENEHGGTGVISFTSGHMRAMLDSFPEVIQMDCTHKTNQYNYQLLTMVAMDQYGQGQPVQYSLIETTSDWHMAKCLDHFKRANEHWRFVRMVIVDKDLREVEVIRKKLPEARVLLCHFHVIKWLHNTIKNTTKFGAYGADVQTQLKHTVTNLTYARSDADYAVHRDEFKSLAGRNDRTELWEYFEKNWDACKDMWVMAFRVDLPHFNNHTNNRVESLFGKLKRRLKGHLTMRASLNVLLDYQRRKEELYKTKVEMPGTLRDVKYSEELNIALGMTTRWVAAAIKTQYDVATDSSVADNYSFKDNGATITVQRENREYLLQKEDWECDCEFSLTMKLPCRHAMAYRRACGSPFVIPFAAIAPRWFGQSRLESHELADIQEPFVAKIFKASRETRTISLNETEKYRRAQQAFARISSELVRFPDDEFEDAMTQFDLWWNNLRQGRATMDPPDTDASRKPEDDDGGSDGGADAGGASEATAFENQPSGGAGGSSCDSRDDSGDETSTQVADAGADSRASVAVKIQLSGSIKPVGRPRLNRNVVREQAKIALKEYNQGIKLRAIFRETDVCEVVSGLETIKPGVREVGSFLATFQVKSSGEKKAVSWRVDGDYVPDRVRFRLCESIIDNALEQLRTGLAQNEEIVLDSDGERSGCANSFVVIIEKVGQFTRDQLEAMKWLWNLQAKCRDAVICCTWLQREVRAVVEQPSFPAGAFEEILNCWPYRPLRGLGFDLTYSDLYCLRDSAWLNDASMRAFAVFLARYGNNVMVLIPPPKKEKETPAKKSDKGILSAKTIIEIGNGAAEHPFVLLPVNFGGSHWGGLVVDRAAKLVKTYDSMGGKRNRQRLKKMAGEISAGPLNDVGFNVCSVEEPMQTDTDSCGVFVCRFFWECVSSEAPTDVSSTGVTKLRWAMLHKIMKTKQR